METSLAEDIATESIIKLDYPTPISETAKLIRFDDH